MTDSTNQLDLGDVIDLSVIELYILNYLIRVAGSVVRFSVFNDINNQLPEKSISRSSFYNSLENLEKKGFVEIDNTDKGRKSAVKALPKAKLAIQQVNIFNIWGSVDPDTKFKNLLINKSNLFASNDTENLLIISLQYPANQEIIEAFGKNFSKLNVLGDEQTIGPISNNFNLVKTDDRGIVERNDEFSQIVIYRYAYNEILFGFDFNTLVRESIRLTKRDGKIIFLALEDIRATSNLILESGIGSVLQDTFEKQSTGVLRKILNEYNNESVSKKTEILFDENINGLSVIIVKIKN